jgi:hypothetical protein
LFDNLLYYTALDPYTSIVITRHLGFHITIRCVCLWLRRMMILSWDKKNRAQALPVDVLQYHIFSILSGTSLVSASMVCRMWRKNIPPNSKQSREALLLSLFNDGASFKFCEWFEKRLGYPVWTSSRFVRGCAQLAAAGMKNRI